MSYFTEAIVWNKCVDSLVARGSCYFENSQLMDALTDFNTAVELNPMSEIARSKKSIVYNQIGVNLFECEKYSEADGEFSKALVYSPADSRIYLNRAKNRIALKRYVEAVEDIVYAYAYNENDKEVHEVAKQYAPKLLRMFFFRKKLRNKTKNQMMNNTEII